MGACLGWPESVASPLAASQDQRTEPLQAERIMGTDSISRPLTPALLATLGVRSDRGDHSRTSLGSEDAGIQIPQMGAGVGGWG